MKKFIVFLLLSCKGIDPYIVSGDSLSELGETFLIAVEGWKVARNEGLVSELEYEKWKEFGERFKKLYPVAVKLWSTAVDLKDASALNQLQEVLTSLSGELGIFMQMLRTAPAHRGDTQLLPVSFGSL